MAYNNHQQVPFWDFVRAFGGQNGAGVDHAEEHPFFGPPPHPHRAGGPMPSSFPQAGEFPWGGPEGFWGPRGFGGPGPHGGPHARRGGHGGRGRRHCRRDRSDGEERSRSRTASPSGDHQDEEGEHSEREAREGSGDERHEHHHRGPRGFGRRGGHGHGHRGGPGGPGAWGHRGHHGGPHGHGRRGPPPFGGPGGPGAFDLSGLFNALNAHPIAQHPWAQVLRQYAEQAGVAQRSADTLVPEDGENTFVPPVDVFSTETAYFIHVALPGAKKEDVGVNFDSDKGMLNIAGIVYRQGDEEFLKTLTQSERKVGVFDRNVKLPPADEEKEEVDGDAITAKLEEGILVVKVPKVEKEWTEVKKVDIN